MCQKYGGKTCKNDEHCYGVIIDSLEWFLCIKPYEVSIVGK